MKKLVIFDLDGTLAQSKAAIDAEMAQLIDHLLALVKVAVKNICHFSSTATPPLLGREFSPKP